MSEIENFGIHTTSYGLQSLMVKIEKLDSKNPGILMGLWKTGPPVPDYCEIQTLPMERAAKTTGYISMLSAFGQL